MSNEAPSCSSAADETYRFSSSISSSSSWSDELVEEPDEETMEHVDVLLFLVAGSPKEGIIGAGDTVAGEISVSVGGGDWHCKGSGSVTVTARGFGTPKFPTFSFTNLTLVGDDSPSGIDLDRVGGGGIS